MKRILQILFILLMSISSASYAQYITAEDNAGNYSSWSNGDDQGFGFGAWDIWTSGSAGVFLGSSVSQGFGNIDTESKAFGMWGNPSGSNYSNAQRLVNNWGDGATFTINIATAYRNGSKGIDVFATGFENVWNFNVGGDKYTCGGVDQSWAYSQESIFLLSVTQNGADIAISLTRGADSYSTTISGKTFYGFKLYEGSTDAGSDLNNLYFNTLKVEYSDPLKVPGTANVKINGVIELGVNQKLSANNLTIIGESSFRIKSGVTGTGSLITNGTITGPVTIERFMTGGWDWHYLSSPVQDQIFIGSGNFILFNFGVGENLGDPDVDIYRFDETATSSPWVNIKAGDGTLNSSFGSPSSDPLFEEGLGYCVAYNGSDPTKWFKGIPNTGDFGPIPLTYTAGGSQGWNMIGNPYPSAIYWESPSMTKTNLASGYYYVYNANMSGGPGYEYYLDVDHRTANVYGRIPAMQGFFVEAASGGGSLTIGNTARVHHDQAYFKEEIEQDENLLKLKISDVNYYYSAQFILSEEGIENADYYDARMLLSMDDGVPQIYSITPDGERLALNSLPLPQENLAIQLGIRSPGNVELTISIENLSTFTNNYAIILENKETQEMIDLRQNESYTFTTNNGGIHNDRFVLHLKTGVGINESSTAVQPLAVVCNHALTVYNLSDGLYKLQLTDVSGRLLFTGNYQPGQSLLLPASLTTGVCLVQLTCEQKTYTQKVVIQ